MFELALPWALALLPLPLLMLLLPAKAKNEAAPLRMPSLMPELSTQNIIEKKSQSPLILLFVIWSLLVISASQPQWLGEPVNVPTEGRELMIAVDLSDSMKMEDMQLQGNAVNRLDMLKALLGEFIARRQGDRLGLILFGDDAYMQTPMTFDRKTVNQMLEEATFGLVGHKTAIGDSIALAVKRFEAKKASNKVLLLLTDGQNTAGKIAPLEALELAVAKDVTIYTIGIGADSMVQKTMFGRRNVNPSSDLDEVTLTKLAQDTNGHYFRAKSSADMSEIYHMLDKLEPIEQESQQMRPLKALFYWPLGIAMTLVLIYVLSLFLASLWRRS